MSNKILSIETSCDETAAAVVAFNRGKIKSLSNIIASQAALFKNLGGVVPEAAARAHVRKILPVVRKALNDAKTRLNDISYIAVTVGPGLSPSLLVGSEFAKGLSYASGKKLIPVNHMLGHLYSGFIANPNLKLPAINLIVSGGHTYIVLIESRKKIKVLGQTVDDAAGEAFDKVAKMLGLPYPGGPVVSKAAIAGKTDYNFPRPMLHAKNFNFSFAGLKTAVLYKIRDEKLSVKSSKVRADICYSFQNAAIDVLVKKTITAAQKYKAKTIIMSGGVAANKMLRNKMKNAAKKIRAGLVVPEFSLCTDNALMIANAAAIKLHNGFKPITYKKIRINPVMGIK